MYFAENIRQLKILGSCPVTVIYRVTAIYRSALQKSKATENFGKLSGDRNIQGDRYIQVSFAQNIRQLKILESCPVIVIYRAVIYRLAVSQIDRCQARLLKTVFSNDSYFFCFIYRALNLPC